MKALLRTISDGDKQYKALMFVCPGCVSGGPEGYEGVHMLPVNVEIPIDKPAWMWDGNLEKPTLSPSILTNPQHVENDPFPRCHSFLREGVFEFLLDSTHPLAGKKIEIPDLPKWVEEMSDDKGESNG